MNLFGGAQTLRSSIMTFLLLRSVSQKGYFRVSPISGSLVQDSDPILMAANSPIGDLFPQT